MGKAFLVLKRKLDRLPVDTRRARLKEFAALAIESGEVYDDIKSLLEDGYSNIVYAGEFYYYVRLLSIERNKELQDVSELINTYLETAQKKVYRIIAAFLFNLDIKAKCAEIDSFLEGFKTRTKLYPSVKRGYQIDLFCEKVLPYLCFIETSDMLFEILYAFIRAKKSYATQFYKIINGWVNLNGGTQCPITPSGKKSLISLVHNLISGGYFVSLNRIHFTFPTLSNEDLYGQPFVEFIQRVPQEVLDNPNSAIYFLNSFKKAYANGEEAFAKWMELYEKSSYANENWFETLAYLERVNINLDILADPKYKPHYKKEDAPVNKIDYEVLDVFAKVLDERPQYALEFLENISSINAFEYHNKPQEYSDNIKTPLKRLYLSKAFMMDYETRLLEYYSLRDFFRIYINSPLHEVSRVDEILDRISKQRNNIDVSKTPLAQVMYKGTIVGRGDSLYFICPKLSEQDLKITGIKAIIDKDNETFDSLLNYKSCLAVAYVESLCPHESIALAGVSVIDRDTESYKDNYLYIKRKTWGIRNRITEIYSNYVKTRQFDKDALAECIDYIGNSPRIYEYQDNAWSESLCVAQTKAFILAAQSETELLDIMECTNTAWNGMLNLFISDPFGQNTVRMSEAGYKKALEAILQGDSMQLYNQLADGRVSARSLCTVYFNSIIKRMLTFDRFFQMLQNKVEIGDDDAEAVVADLKSSIFAGRVTFYDKEHGLVYVKPVSFNGGLSKYVVNCNRHIVINQVYYFAIDGFNDGSDTCYIRSISTKAELLKHLPQEAFKSALLAYLFGAKYFSDSDICKILNSKKIPELFSQKWYNKAIHHFFISLIAMKRNLVDAINALGVNNAFLYQSELLSPIMDLDPTEVNTYKEYISSQLREKSTAVTSNLVYIFMNSPMRSLVEINFLADEYLKINDSIIDLIAEFMQYKIEIEILDDEMSIRGIVCKNYDFIGEKGKGAYYLTDYDANNKAVILKKCVSDDKLMSGLGDVNNEAT